MIKAIIFDYGRTIHDPDTDQLFTDADSLLGSLKNQGIVLILVSRAQNVTKRKEDFKKMKLEKYFQKMYVVKRDDTKQFGEILKKIQVTPQETIVIGDRIKSEILEGNKIGAITVWFKNGKFAGELPTSEEEKPNFIISSLIELKPIIQKTRLK